MLYKWTYSAMCCLGRQFGGIPPRRVPNRIQALAFPPSSLSNKSLYRWVCDRYGLWHYLHPASWIDHNILAYGQYDPKLHQALRNFVKPGWRCLDVGGNIGHISLYLTQLVGATGRVDVFEPIPAHGDIIKQNIIRNHFSDRLFLHQLALGDRVEIAMMDVAGGSEANLGMGTLAYSGNERLASSLEVQTTTLDQWAEETGADGIDLIKIDIQGHEPAFLRGAIKTLRDLRPRLLVEISPDDLSPQGLRNQDLIEQIESHNYDIFSLEKSGAKITPKTVDNHHCYPNVICVPA